MDYHDKVKYYQRQMESAQRKLQQVWFNNFEEVACEVILNVLTEGWRRDIARDLIESYYEEVHGIPVNGSWVLQQLEREDYIGDSKSETGWGEHDHFIYLKDRGKQVVEGILPILT